LQPPSAPRPIFAQFVQATGLYTVEFDKLLVDGFIFGGNWECKDGQWRHYVPGGAAVVSGSLVTALLPLVQPILEPPHAEYHAAPPDLIGRNGLPVAAFDDFPITII